MSISAEKFKIALLEKGWGVVLEGPRQGWLMKMSAEGSWEPQRELKQFEADNTPFGEMREV